MATPRRRPGAHSLIVDFGSLLFLGAVWGGAFLFLRIAAPEVGPAWAAEIRLAIGASVLLAFAGRRRSGRTRPVTTFPIVGAVRGGAVHPHRVRDRHAAGRVRRAPQRRDAAVHGAQRGRVHAPEDLRARRGGLAVGVLAVIVLVGWSPLEPGATTIVAVAAGLGAPELRDRRHVRPGAPGGRRAGRARDRHGDRWALVALPVALLSGAPGRSPSMARSPWSPSASCRRRSPGRSSSESSPHHADRREHGHLHRPGVRHRLGLAILGERSGRSWSGSGSFSSACCSSSASGRRLMPPIGRSAAARGLTA